MTFREWCALYRPEWANGDPPPVIPAPIRPNRAGTQAEREAWMRGRQAKKLAARKQPPVPLPPMNGAPGAHRHPNSLIVQLAHQLRAKGVF